MTFGGFVKRAAVLGAVVLVLAGCSGVPEAVPSTAVPKVALSTPTPTPTPTVLSAQDAFRATLRTVNPKLDTPDAIARAYAVCSGKDRESWDNDALISDTRAKFGGPAEIDLTPAEAKTILSALLDSFCHA
jgi:hypothetical protein